MARDVARRILPPTRSRFSKHQFTQPQLLAILCLMRYEDGTFREAQVRLGEHRELREILQLRSVPHYTTLYRFLRRLDDDTITRGVGETVRRLRRGKKQVRVSAAVEGTGLSYNAVSTFFIRRIEQHSRGMTCHRHWLKWLVIADVKQQILLAQRGKDRGALREHCLLCSTPPGNGCLCARCWPMPSSIPKLITNISGSAGEPVASFPPNRAAASREGQFVIRCTGLFRKKEYGQRVQIETIFSVIKRKLFSRAPGRSLPVQIRQALLLGLTYNLSRLRHRLRLRGCQQSHFESCVLEVRILQELRARFS